MDGPQGFDKSKTLWKDAGWKEIRDLRKMLEKLKELTNLVNSLGRSSGKGPLKRAPQQVLILFLCIILKSDLFLHIQSAFTVALHRSTTALPQRFIGLPEVKEQGIKLWFTH